MPDVLVIGAGLSGTMAALAAKTAGAKVAIASCSYGATALSTGALDIAYAPALSTAAQGERTVAEHVMDIIAHRPRHPYAILGLERSLQGVRDGFDVLRGALADLGPSQPVDLGAPNRALASSVGACMPAAASLAAHEGLDCALSCERPWGIVQLVGDDAFVARRVAAGVGHDAAQLSDRPVRWVELAATVERAEGPLGLARLFDDRRAVERLGAALRDRCEGLAGLIVPPVLGLEQSGEARRLLRELVGVPVVEALAHAPSVPGVRLQRALDRALAAAGVLRVGEIAPGALRGSRVDEVTTTDHLALRVGAVVLASGRFVSGGVRLSQDCREAIFGLPVVTELGPLEASSPLPVVRESPVDSHPLMTAGVLVDEALQPLREGVVAAANLFAAGMVLGGFASRYALCADGVALATGVLAGRAAAAAAGGS